MEKISALYRVCSLICAANKILTMKSSEDCVFLKKIFTFNGLSLFEPLYLSSLLFQQTYVSFPLFSSYTLSLQVQTEPLKSSSLVRFQIYWRALAGPSQICFSSAEKMERLLFSLLIACDEWHVITTHSISAEQWSHLDKHQLWSGNVLSGNLSHWKKQKISGYYILMNVNHQD